MADTVAHQGLLNVEPDTVRCPYPACAHLRADHPVQWLEPLQAYAVTRYEDISEVLRHPEAFSSKRNSGPGAATPRGNQDRNDPIYQEL